jgi:hypothetical protein
LIRKRDECDPERLQFFKEGDQVLEIPSEPIEAPDDEHIEPATACIRQERVECRAPVLCTADAFVDVLVQRPVASPCKTPELGELIFRFLVEGRYPSVDHRTHSAPPFICSARSNSAHCGARTDISPTLAEGATALMTSC